MGSRIIPIVGQWYERRDKGDLFQVVALDETQGTIEIQEFDGNLDELDIESWREMSPQEAAAPEDWSGPVGDLDLDELGYTDYEVVAADEEPVAMTWEEAVEDEEDLDAPPMRRLRGPEPRSHRHH